MSENTLNILAPTSYDNVGAIVGDQLALMRLRNAISDALDSGTGGTCLVQSGGDAYYLTVLEVRDMSTVSPTRVAQPKRVSTTPAPVCIRALPGFLQAMEKAKLPPVAKLNIPRFVRLPQ